jgi:hypothetical protein
MASDARQRLASRFIAAQQVGSPLTGFTPLHSSATQNAANHQAKLNEIMSKYAGSGVATQDRTITIHDLVRKMHRGNGLKVIQRPQAGRLAPAGRHHSVKAAVLT